MTEPGAEHVDVFYRQALLAGNRVPLLWGGPFELLKMLHEEADVDVGELGTAMDGIVEVESLEQAKSLPWAARFLKCKTEAEEVCKEEPRFCSTCWIDREDKIVPEAKQLDKPRGQVKWHPGWRSHQLMGRNLAFAILEGLQSAVNIWSEGVMGASFVLQFDLYFLRSKFSIAGVMISNFFFLFNTYGEKVVLHWKMSCGMSPTIMKTFETK